MNTQLQHNIDSYQYLLYCSKPQSSTSISISADTIPCLSAFFLGSVSFTKIASLRALANFVYFRTISIEALSVSNGGRIIFLIASASSGVTSMNLPSTIFLKTVGICFSPSSLTARLLSANEIIDIHSTSPHKATISPVIVFIASSPFKGLKRINKCSQAMFAANIRRNYDK